VWFISGSIFLVLGLTDIFFASMSTKSTFIIILEFVSATLFLNLSFVLWKKHKAND
jgi:hypothetical protein